MPKVRSRVFFSRLERSFFADMSPFFLGLTYRIKERFAQFLLSNMCYTHTPKTLDGGRGGGRRNQDIDSFFFLNLLGW